MLTKKPLVTIVTPSYNQGRFIEETIGSALSQNYPEIEYIVIDGGSSDQTVQILRKYGKRVRWTSEPDQGQTDAINKGFEEAKGEVLGWLNADDTYDPTAVSRVVDHFLAHPEILMVYGDAYFIDRGGQIIGKYPTEPFNLQRLSETCFICQPTVFLRTEVFKTVGLLDILLQTCMDYDYWIRIGKHYGSERISYLRGEFLAHSRVYGEIKTFRMRETFYVEAMETAKKHFGYVPWPWIFGYIRDIVLDKKLKRFERFGFLVNPLLLIYFMPKFLQNLKGSRYLWKYLGGNLKSFREYIKRLL